MGGYSLQLHSKVGMRGMRRKRTGIGETKEENTTGLEAKVGVGGVACSRGEAILSLASVAGTKEYHKAN